MLKKLGIRRINISLKAFLLIYLMALSLIVVLGYTNLVNNYFIHGLVLTNSLPMRAAASTFSQNYRQNPDTPVPFGYFAKGYLGKEQLPTWINEQFPRRNFKHGELYSKAWWPEGVPHNNEHRHYLILMAYELHDGRQLFLFNDFNPEEMKEGINSQYERVSGMIYVIALLTIAALFAATLLLVMFLRGPIKRLSNWASELTLENKDYRPDFYYQELDEVAERLQDSFDSISELLERERSFLRHASHELCTPIAVLNSNIELLNRLRPIDPNDKNALESWQRIERAASNMRHMTETLLWLSRESEIVEVWEEIDLAGLVRELIEENQYLLADKNVELKLDLQTAVHTLNPTLSRIVLNNLTRNAFQYTDNGYVKIAVRSGVVTVENHDFADQEATGASAGVQSWTDYGFGLGLRLVNQICDKLNWHFDSQSLAGGRRVTVRFP